MNRIKPVVVRAARGFGCVSNTSLTVAVSAGFGGPAVGFMCSLWPQVVLRRVGDEERARCSSPGREKRPMSADHASNRIKTRASPATLEPFHICFPHRDGESTTLCSLIFSKKLPVKRHHFQIIVHYKQPSAA